MNCTHFLLSFKEKNNGTHHAYCYFSVPEYITSNATDILQSWVPGDTTKRHIVTVRNKVLDEGIFKIYRNDTLWRIIDAWIKGFGAEHIYPIDTIRIPVDSVTCGQQLFGTFYLERVTANPGVPYGIQV
jgi:hypothetical protein